MLRAMRDAPPALPADGGLGSLLSPPFVLGEGPFQIKGNAYRGHMSYVERFVPGGHAAQAEALRSISAEQGELLAAYFDQRFKISTWYDVYPLAIAGAACAQLTGEDFRTFVYNRTCVQAREDIGGLHRFLLRFVSAKQIAVRMPGLMSRYFNFYEVESRALDEHTLQTCFRGMPLPLMPWLQAVMEAYIVTVLEIAGSPRAHAEDIQVRLEGEAHGVPLCSSDSLLRFGAEPQLG